MLFKQLEKQFANRKSICQAFQIPQLSFHRVHFTIQDYPLRQVHFKALTAISSLCLLCSLPLPFLKTNISQVNLVIPLLSGITAALSTESNAIFQPCFKTYKSDKTRTQAAQNILKNPLNRHKWMCIRRNYICSFLFSPFSAI